MKQHSFAVLLAALAVLVPARAMAATRVAIVTEPGRFGSIEQAALAEAQVDWWDDDKADDAACTESFAAVELRRFLARCLAMPEADVALVSPPHMPAEGLVMVIASDHGTWLGDAFPAAAHDDFAPPGAESFRIRTFVEPKRTVVVIKGRDRAGALYGTYAFVEKLGVRFYGLGDKGTIWPKELPVAVPATLDESSSPDYQTRGFWAFELRGDEEFFTWMARNRLNFWTVAKGQDNHRLKKLGLRLTGGHHNVQFVCIGPKREYPYRHPEFGGSADRPADPYAVSPGYAGDADRDGKLSYFEAHPEWYCLKDGRRSSNVNAEFGDNYCTSNRDATNELTRRIVQECVSGEWSEADILNFWMLDNGKWCSCESCRDQGTYTDRLMVVVDATLKAMRKAREEGRLKRRIQVISLAYHETLAAPTKPLPADFDYDSCGMTFFPIERCFAHDLADPTCTEINADVASKYLSWTTGAGRPYTGSMFIGEYYNVSAFKALPLVFTRVMAADIPWYFNHGARHFHYMHTLTKAWGTWTVNQMLMARLLWDTRVDAERLLAEYYRSCYPTTSETTRRFYAALEVASANSKALKHYVRTADGIVNLRNRLANPKLSVFPTRHLQYRADASGTNDAPDLMEMAEAMSRARRELDGALLSCTDAAERARLQEDEHRFAYGEAMFGFYLHLIQTALLHRQGASEDARREFQIVQELAAKLKDMVDVVQFAGAHAGSANGYAATLAEKPFEYFNKIYGRASEAPGSHKPE